MPIGFLNMQLIYQKLSDKMVENFAYIAFSHEPKFPFKFSSNLTDRKTFVTNGLSKLTEHKYFAEHSLRNTVSFL